MSYDITAWRKVRQETLKRLAAKWDRTGLLSQLPTDEAKGKMATLLENQARQLVVEDTKSKDLSRWSGIALPLVYRIFHTLVTRPDFDVAFTPAGMYLVDDQLIPCVALSKQVEIEPLDISGSDMICYSGLDMEMELTAMLAERLEPKFHALFEQGKFVAMYIPLVRDTPSLTISKFVSRYVYVPRTTEQEH